MDWSRTMNIILASVVLAMMAGGGLLSTAFIAIAVASTLLAVGVVVARRREAWITAKIHKIAAEEASMHRALNDALEVHADFHRVSMGMARERHRMACDLRHVTEKSFRIAPWGIRNILEGDNVTLGLAFAFGFVTVRSLPNGMVACLRLRAALNKELAQCANERYVSSSCS